jgi:hypothetical protein
MRRPRIAIALAAIAAALLTAHADPSWARDAGLDVWNVSAASADRRAAQDRWEELQDIRAELALRSAANRGVFARLADDEVSLADAAEQLDRTNRDRPGWVERLRAEYPGAATDRGAHARWAIEWVRNSLEDDPSRQADVCARLERAYRAMTSRASREPAVPPGRSE